MSDETYETKPGEIIAMKLRSEIDALKAENTALRESLKDAVEALNDYADARCKADVDAIVESIKQRHGEM